MRVRKTVIAAITIIAAFLAFDCIQNNSVYASDKQGTDGTEINAYEAEELEIYLGKDFVGKNFKLETDAGIYPGAVSVDNDGVLRVEMGGSKNYKLSVMDDGEDKKSKDNDTTDKPTENDKIEEDDKTNSDKVSSDNNNTENNIIEVTQPLVSDEVTNADIAGKSEGVNVEWKKDDNKNEITVLGIPLKHLIIFIVGLIVAIDGLIVINLIQRKRKEDYEYEDYDEEYYDDEYENEE